MAKPLWTGAISFGLIHIPVQLMPGERRVDLRFHLLDERDKARVRYERVNADTGEEVPWKNIVKAYEYQKGSYVVVQDEDFKRAAPESSESVEIEAFVEPDAIGPEYMERPYYLVPPKKAEKGYVLLRDTLAHENKVGIARVVIRTREHLALLRPQGEALQLILLRFPQELVPADEHTFPGKNSKGARISAKETEMARQLVQSMSASWNPKNYKDDYREKLSQAIKARMKRAGAKITKPAAPAAAEAEPGKVVDFMALLKKSIDSKRRTPAAPKTAARTAVRKRAGRAR